ncbi:MAG: ATP-binding protein [Pseudomonadota bacterium]
MKSGPVGKFLRSILPAWLLPKSDQPREPQGAAVDSYVPSGIMHQRFVFGDANGRGIVWWSGRLFGSPEEIMSALSVRNLPEERDELEYLVDELSKLSIAALDDDSKKQELHSLAKSNALLAGTALRTSESLHFLKSLHSEPDPGVFRQMVREFYTGVKLRIADEIMSGNEGRARAVVYAEEIARGPLWVASRIFDASFPRDRSFKEMLFGHFALFANMILELIGTHSRSDDKILEDTENLLRRNAPEATTEALGGKAEVESEPGRGTTVRLEIDMSDWSAGPGISPERFATLVSVAAVPRPDDGFPAELLTTELPATFPGVKALGDGLADLAVYAASGDEESANFITRIASSDSILAGPARELPVNGDFLRELLGISKPDKFEQRAKGFFNGVFARIAPGVMAGGKSREDALRYARDTWLGPAWTLMFIFERVFGDALDSQTEIVVRVHGELFRRLVALGAVPKTGEARVLKILSDFATYDRRTLNLRDRTTQVLLPVAVQAFKSGVRIDVDLPHGLRYRDGLVFERADQILLGLARSAADRYDAARSERGVRVWWDKGKKAIVVEDNGKWIADLNGAWKKGAEKVNYLWLAERSAEELGWRIEVDSEEGAGTRFTVIPRKGDIIDSSPTGGNGSGGSAGPAAEGGGGIIVAGVSGVSLYHRAHVEGKKRPSLAARIARERAVSGENGVPSSMTGSEAVYFGGAAMPFAVPAAAVIAPF